MDTLYLFSFFFLSVGRHWRFYSRLGEGAVCVQRGRRWIVGHIVMNWWLALLCSCPPTYSWLLIFMVPGPFNGACRARRLIVQRLPLCLTRAGVKLSKRNIVIWRMRTRPGTVHNLSRSAPLLKSWGLASIVSLLQNSTLESRFIICKACYATVTQKKAELNITVLIFKLLFSSLIVKAWG